MFALSRRPRRSGCPSIGRRFASRVRLRVEELEPRTLLSGFTPAQIAHAYGFDSVSFTNAAGQWVPGDGAGQTIAIVVSNHDSSIGADLRTFDNAFGLPDPPKFTVADPQGTPSQNAGWALEASMDVEWAHAIAPAARILLVEVKSQNLADLLAGVNYARKQPGVSVVSMSWGAPEWSGETYYDACFTTPLGHIGGSGLPGGITFVAATGDTGGHVQWPATSLRVLAVGATTLTLDLSGNYQSEQGWYLSGGGVSRYEPRPTYQNGVQTTAHRTNPDVAMIGNWNAGAEIYNTTGGGWQSVGGTSLGTPIWAGLIAVADQGRNLHGLGSLGPAQTQALIYRLSAGDFHDITTGSNGYSAHAGYDLVTGRGTPYADLIIPYLLGSVTSSALPSANTVPGSLGSATVAGGAVGGHSLAVPAGVGPIAASPGTDQPLPVGLAMVWLGTPMPVTPAVAVDGGRSPGSIVLGLPAGRASSERLDGGSGGEATDTLADPAEPPSETAVPGTREEADTWTETSMLPGPAGPDLRPADPCFADDGWVDSLLAPAAADMPPAAPTELDAGHASGGVSSVSDRN